jgi:hypothetical protein
MAGERGRGGAGMKPVLLAVEKRGKHVRFIAAEVIDAITKKSVRGFLRRHIHPAQKIRTDSFPASNAVVEEHNHKKKVTPQTRLRSGCHW